MGDVGGGVVGVCVVCGYYTRCSMRVQAMGIGASQDSLGASWMPFSRRSLLTLEPLSFISSESHSVFLPISPLPHISPSLPLIISLSLVFHWHIVDSPSFPYGSAKYPELAKEGSWSGDDRTIYDSATVSRVWVV